MTNPATTKVFNYVRGALRGAYGIEDFRGKSVLIIGINEFGQDLVSKICFDEEVSLYFQVDQRGSLQNYLNAFTVCALVAPWDGHEVDIVVNTLTQQVTVNGTTSDFEEIGENPYAQGIQDFYL